MEKLQKSIKKKCYHMYKMNAEQEKIQWLLHESGESMYKVAKETGITQATLSRLKSGITSLEKLPFEKAAKLTTYAKQIRGGNNMRTWERKGYEVIEKEFDGDLHHFDIMQDDEVVATIEPETIDDMQLIKADLDAGEDVNGWEDGNGNTIYIEELN